MTDELRIEVERSRQCTVDGKIWQREAGHSSKVAVSGAGQPHGAESGSDGLRLAMEEGAKAERAAIVKWLRGLEQIWRDLEAEGEGSREERAARSMLAENYRVISAAIERGEHGGGE